jgi:hypothetical protein
MQSVFFIFVNLILIQVTAAAFEDIELRHKHCRPVIMKAVKVIFVRNQVGLCLIPELKPLEIKLRGIYVEKDAFDFGNFDVSFNRNFCGFDAGIGS